MLRNRYKISLAACLVLSHISVCFGQRFLDQLEGVLDAESSVAEEPLPERFPGYLGFVGVEEADGVSIEMVRPNSPAERAGLRTGDVLLQVQGRAVTTLDQVGEALAGLFAGEKVDLIVRRDGKQRVATATLARRPATVAEVEDVPPEPDPFAPDKPAEATTPTLKVEPEIRVDALDALRTLEGLIDEESAKPSEPVVDRSREKRITTYQNELDAIKRRIRELERQVEELAGDSE